MGEIVEAHSLTHEQITTTIVENLQKIPKEQVEALTRAAKKLVITNLKRRKQLIREQVNWENSRASAEEKEEVLQKVLFRFAHLFTKNACMKMKFQMWTIKMQNLKSKQKVT